MEGRSNLSSCTLNPCVSSQTSLSLSRMLKINVRASSASSWPPKAIHLSCLESSFTILSGDGMPLQTPSPFTALSTTSNSHDRDPSCASSSRRSELDEARVCNTAFRKHVFPVLRRPTRDSFVRLVESPKRSEKGHISSKIAHILPDYD